MTTSSDPLAAYALGLYWGIKRSFIEYVRRMPDGKIWVGDGAEASPQVELLFAPESDELTTDETGEVRQLKFTGAVQFVGHFGMLQLHLRDPWVTLRDGKGELTILQGTDAGSRLPLVSFELTEHTVNEEGLELLVAGPPSLSEAGVLIFNEVYSQGEEFDPLIIALRHQGS